MLLYYISIGIGVLCFVCFMYLRVKKQYLKATVAKSVTSLLFVASAAAATAVNVVNYKYASLIIVGLVCGLLGDVWLDLKYAYPKDSKFFLGCGFSSFLVGQIFYIFAVCICAGLSFWQISLCALIAIAAAFVTILMEKPLKMIYGEFKAIVFAYAVFLSMTVASSVAYAIVSSGSVQSIIMTVGSVLFFLSDVILSGTYFGKDKDTAPYVVTNHLFYYAGQFLIASSVLFTAWK